MMTPGTVRRRRGRPGQALSHAQHERLCAERNAQRRDLLAELIHEHIRRCGQEGFSEIERLACDARDRLLPVGEEGDGPGEGKEEGEGPSG